MLYEVFIPSPDEDGFDVTLRVEANNWTKALKTGLDRVGEAMARNVMCDIKSDNSIHVTDATTRRVFVIREIEADAEAIEGAVKDPDLDDSPPKATVTMEALDRTGESPAPKKVPQELLDRKRAEAEAKAQQDAQAQQDAEAQAARLRQAEEEARRREEALREEEARKAREAQQEAARREQERQAQEAQQAQQAQPQSLEEHSATSENLEVGSATFEALKRDNPEEEPRVVSEERARTGERPSVQIGRPDEKVSEFLIEDVFLEIQEIHEGQLNMEQAINFVMDMVVDKLDAESGSILFADVNGKELYFATARGPKAKEVMSFRVPMGQGLVGFCSREGVSLAIGDAQEDPRFYEEISKSLGYETRSLACVPVQHEGRVYGAIEAINKRGGSSFTGQELNAMAYMGRQLALFVHDVIMAQKKLD